MRHALAGLGENSSSVAETQEHCTDADCYGFEEQSAPQRLSLSPAQPSFPVFQERYMAVLARFCDMTFVSSNEHALMGDRQGMVGAVID